MYVPIVIVKLSLTKNQLIKRLYSGGLVFEGSGNLLENHGVLINAERISNIAPIGELEGYSGEKVDTSGGTLLPGLIYCHVHWVYCGEADPKSSLLKLGPAQIVMKASKMLRII